MGIEDKMNLVMAVNGYKSVKRQRFVNCTDVTALDTLNKKILLRIIEPLGEEYIGLNDIKEVSALISCEGYDAAIVFSKKFTCGAVSEMVKQKIRYVSDDCMLPFTIKGLYAVVVECINSQCVKQCGVSQDGSGCKKIVKMCGLNVLISSAKSHFDAGAVGLLKNDLKMALAVNRQFLQHNSLENLPY